MAAHFSPCSDNVDNLILHEDIEEALFQTDIQKVDEEILLSLTKEMDDRRDITQQLANVIDARRYGVH